MRGLCSGGDRMIEPLMFTCTRCFARTSNPHGLPVMGRNEVEGCKNCRWCGGEGQRMAWKVGVGVVRQERYISPLKNV